MVARDDLVDFIKRTFKEKGIELEMELADDTSLLQSGLFDSVAILHLVTWIETATGASLDLMTVEPIRQWDTISSILDFCNEHVKS